jgi:hypothetical protein
VDGSQLTNLPGGATFNGYAVGNWIYPIEAPLAPFTSSLPPNTASGMPFTVKRLIRVSGLGSRVVTGVTGASVQFAVYDSLTGNPNNLIASTSGLSAGTSNQNISDTLVAPFLLFPERTYWWFVNSDSTPTMQAVSNALSSLVVLVGTPDINSLFIGANTMGNSRHYGIAYGTWPNLSAMAFGSRSNFQNAAPALLISAFS